MSLPSSSYSREAPATTTNQTPKSISDDDQNPRMLPDRSSGPSSRHRHRLPGTVVSIVRRRLAVRRRKFGQRARSDVGVRTASDRGSRTPSDLHSRTTSESELLTTSDLQRRTAADDFFFMVCR
ncbi:unnamed protein product [Linum trigynum]|uniref:Uncharacterized protein n=1 Tax=Linum trigynum TaxID=586398 RepID=A0AAV2DMY1_9ROSI